MALFRASVASSSILHSIRSLSTGAGELVESRAVPYLKSMMNQMFTLDISSQTGSCMPLSSMPICMQIHNIELRPGQGGKLVRAAGTCAKILTEPNRSASLQWIRGVGPGRKNHLRS